MNYIAEWLDSYRRFWEQRMERLEEYLRSLQEKDSRNGKPKSTGEGKSDERKH